MRLIVSLVAIALAVIFGALLKVWAGFQFFALSVFALLGIYWFVVLLIDYIANYRKIDEQRFGLYVAQLINSSDLTLEMVESARKFYIKKYKRSLWREKLIEVAKILFALGVVIMCVTGIVTLAIR